MHTIAQSILDALLYQRIDRSIECRQSFAAACRRRNQGVAAKCFSAVSAAGVNIEMISFGSSDASLYFLVEEKSLDVAIQTLHREFFESDN